MQPCDDHLSPATAELEYIWYYTRRQDSCVRSQLLYMYQLSPVVYLSLPPHFTVDSLYLRFGDRHVTPMNPLVTFKFNRATFRSKPKLFDILTFYTQLNKAVFFQK